MPSALPGGALQLSWHARTCCLPHRGPRELPAALPRAILPSSGQGACPAEAGAVSAPAGGVAPQACPGDAGPSSPAPTAQPEPRATWCQQALCPWPGISGICPATLGTEGQLWGRAQKARISCLGADVGTWSGGRPCGSAQDCSLARPWPWAAHALSSARWVHWGPACASFLGRGPPGTAPWSLCRPAARRWTCRLPLNRSFGLSVAQNRGWRLPACGAGGQGRDRGAGPWGGRLVPSQLGALASWSPAHGPSPRHPWDPSKTG